MAIESKECFAALTEDGQLWEIYQAAQSMVNSVTATAPITSTGGSNPNISTSISTSRLAGRTSAGTGVMEEISVGSGLTLASGTLRAAYEATIACSDEITALTTGAAKVTFRAPFAFRITAVRSSVTTAPTGSTIVVDINNGANSVLSTKLSIDATEKTSVTAAVPPVINATFQDFADDAEITIDIDQVGSTIAGSGLKVTLYGTRL